MAKYTVALDAGHGKNTAGKRTPDGEREWTFNNVVLLAAQAELKKYADITLIRLDDPTGNRDVPLVERTNKAKAAKADVLVSIHHNANTGKYGTWTGTETFVQETFAQNPKSHALAKAVHPRYVKAFGLKDRGIKTNNFHMLRETNYYENGVKVGMAAILTEGGYMDSSIDIKALRSNTRLKAQGVAIADGIAAYLNVKSAAAPVAVKPVAKPVVVAPKPIVKPIVKEVEYMLEKAIIVNSFIDYPAAEPLAKRLKAPIYVSKASYPANAAREVLVIGADVSGVKAAKVVSIAGPGRFDTYKLVDEYIDKM